MLMIGSVRKIDFDDLTEAVPAFACIALMVFTYNIANGLTAGLVLYPVGKIVAGRARELNWGSIVLLSCASRTSCSGCRIRERRRLPGSPWTV